MEEYLIILRRIGRIILFLIPLAGCIAIDNRVDHSIEIHNAGNTPITDVIYTYGELGPRLIQTLGLGGKGVEKPMIIPEFVDVTWTTEVDRKRHEAHVPLKSLVSAWQVSGNIISIEIDGATLAIYLVKRLADFKKEREKIY